MLSYRIPILPRDSNTKQLWMCFIKPINIIEGTALILKCYPSLISHIHFSWKGQLVFCFFITYHNSQHLLACITLKAVVLICVENLTPNSKIILIGRELSQLTVASPGLWSRAYDFVLKSIYLFLYLFFTPPNKDS